MASTPGRAATSLAFSTASLRRVGSGSGHDGHASGHDFDGDVDDPQPLVVRKSRSLAGGAAGNQKINSGLDLPCHQVAQGGLVDGAVLTEGSYERCTASTKLHDNKITRMEETEVGLYSFPPDILEVEETLLVRPATRRRAPRLRRIRGGTWRRGRGRSYRQGSRASVHACRPRRLRGTK